MKRTITTASLLLILLASVVFNGFSAKSTSEDERQDISFIIKRKLIISNPDKGTKIWNVTEEDRTIGLFMNNTWQTVRLTNVSHNLETTKLDDDGNPVAVLRFTRIDLKPGEKMSFAFTHHVLSKPRSLPDIAEEKSGTLKDIPEDLKEKYTKNEGPWLVSDQEIQNLTYNITNNELNVLAVVKKFVTWIWSEIQIPKDSHDAPLYPNETLKHREGDCDDQANLFITMCRIYGIPSYLQIGLIYQPLINLNKTRWRGHLTSVQKGVGGHGWAIVYIPPWGWLPVDLTYPLGGFDDPINAIKTAVVTSQNTIQNINITQTDYIASEVKTVEFLEKNDFYIWAESEMIQEVQPASPGGVIITDWLLWIPIAVFIVTFAGVFVYLKKIRGSTQREKRRRET